MTVKLKLYNNLKIYEPPFFSTIIRLTTFWDYEPKTEYDNEKKVNMRLVAEIHLKCDCIEGSVVSGTKSHLFLSFLTWKDHLKI